MLRRRQLPLKRASTPSCELEKKLLKPQLRLLRQLLPRSQSPLKHAQTTQMTATTLRNTFRRQNCRGTRLTSLLPPDPMPLCTRCESLSTASTRMSGMRVKRHRERSPSRKRPSLYLKVLHQNSPVVVHKVVPVTSPPSFDAIVSLTISDRNSRILARSNPSSRGRLGSIRQPLPRVSFQMSLVVLRHRCRRRLIRRPRSGVRKMDLSRLLLLRRRRRHLSNSVHVDCLPTWRL